MITLQQISTEQAAAIKAAATKVTGAPARLLTTNGTVLVVSGDRFFRVKDDASLGAEITE